MAADSPELVPCRRLTCEELLEDTREVVRIVPRDLSSFTSAYWHFARENAAHAITNKVTRLRPEEFSFRAFSITGSPAGWPLATDNDEDPYLIIEENTCYEETNLAWLGFWLAIKRGVSRVDGKFNSDELLTWRSAVTLFPEVLQAGQMMKPANKKG